MEKTITLRAHAKVNWVLSVEGKRADGYHELATLMQPLSLYDEVVVSAARDVRVECDLALDGENIAGRAASAFVRRFGTGGAHITISKHIPVQAGLGGGSADAAAVLRAMAALYGAQDEAALLELARSIGADVPFCLLGRSALARGVGEVLTPLKAARVPLVLAQPEGGVSTAQAFATLTPGAYPRYDTATAAAALQSGDLHALARALGNSLEGAATALNGGIAAAVRALRESGALGAGMSGSGSCCFGIYESMQAAHEAARAIKAPFVWAGWAIEDAWGTQTPT